MADNQQSLQIAEAVRMMGQAPSALSASAPTQQNFTSPATIRPNDGVRVDEGADLLNPNGSVPNPSPSPNPNPNPNPKPGPNPNPNPKAGSSGKKDSKIKLWAIAIVVGLLLVLILLIVFKDRGSNDIMGADPTPTPEIVQDWEEYEDPFGLGNGDEWEVVAFAYTAEELASLRRVGYTADEIEQFQLEEKDAESLVEEAEKAREEYLEETLEPFYKGRSEKFKKLEASTWIGLEEVDRDDIPTTPEQWDAVSTSSVTINTDYEKVEPRGHQLFLKIYISDDDDDWIYYQCSYKEWSQLKDKGNIVVIANKHVLDTEENYYEYWEVEGINIY